MNSPKQDIETFIPGYVPQKIFMLIFGLVLFLAGILELSFNFKIWIMGHSAEAQGFSIIKSKPGHSDLVFNNDLAVESELKLMDRNCLYWNVFRFQRSDGTMQEARIPTPSLVKPMYDITDEDGIPTHLPVYYEEGDSSHVLFPTVFSSWVFPALLAVIGTIAAGCASILLAYACKPIELPALDSDKLA